jgi:hypothetical protein
LVWFELVFVLFATANRRPCVVPYIITLKHTPSHVIVKILLKREDDLKKSLAILNYKHTREEHIGKRMRLPSTVEVKKPIIDNSTDIVIFNQKK